ncbi:flagellar biosynthetic protein FliR [Desulfovibrio subterraneus]|jgi:flagellar biosynthetic protein FliR|uniref:Flagellar biosynthetic protein FliR n=2 Tax=Desulfovibrio subterraneus TaxID=2718620 RepID=A0A7J0BNT1_9BACT|nr:flagellar biosynthetic protein FliR [Desulfovibrio subterraneus]
MDENAAGCLSTPENPWRASATREWLALCKSDGMDLFNFNTTEFFSFLLTFMRLSLVVFMLPVFGGESAPKSVKAALCIVLTLALFPALAIKGQAMPEHPFDLIRIMASEAVLGLVLALAVDFIFAGIQTGGQILGFQMGFTMINVADPLTGTTVSITSHFLYLVSLLTFMTLNGHLHMLRALAQTFEAIPPGQLVIGPAIVHQILDLSGIMFTLAVKIAAPVMAALFLVELALALMGRAAPQMNLLQLGFPLKIGVGFFFMGLLFTIMSRRIGDFIIEIGPLFSHLIDAMSPLPK